MLVLSRRENQKVLFPGLGISVEVIRAGSNKVQLGIEAPREIRVLRDELPYRDRASCDEQMIVKNGSESSQDQEPSEAYEVVHQELKAAALAVHLAKNQIHQGLEESAESALNDALATLERIESKLYSHSNPGNKPGGLSPYSSMIGCDKSTEFVSETRSDYEVSSKRTSALKHVGELNVSVIRRMAGQCFETFFDSTVQNVQTKFLNTNVN